MSHLEKQKVDKIVGMPSPKQNYQTVSMYKIKILKKIWKKVGGMERNVCGIAQVSNYENIEKLLL